MKTEDKNRIIASARAKAPATLGLRWSDGANVKLDLGGLLREKHFRALNDPNLRKGRRWRMGRQRRVAFLRRVQSRIPLAGNPLGNPPCGRANFSNGACAMAYR